MADPYGAVQAVCKCVTATGLPATIAAEADSFFHVEDHRRSLRTAVEKLQALAKWVQAMVDEEVNRLNKPDPQAHLWLKMVKDTLREDVEEDYNKLQKCPGFCGCTPNLSRRYRLGKQITRKIQDVAKFIEEGRQLKTFGQKPPPDPGEDWPSMQTFGMDHVLAQLRESFNNKEIGIIGVWGPGGVGKTTLLHAFNNDLNKHGVFHVVAVEISNSETLDVEDIQRKIADRLELPWNNMETVHARAKYLTNALKKKRSVILLDDVREKFHLGDIGIPTPDPENQCKLILASRFEHVCIQMDAHHNLIEMKLLEEAAAWSLFRSNLRPNATAAIDLPDPKNMIRQCAETIAKRCGGLPLALNVIGRAVAGLKDLEEWRYAMNATSSTNIGALAGIHEMFHQLKYSYDRLDPKLRQCFLYCTLFPEYSSIKKDLLVDYWLAEDLISNDPDHGHYFIRGLVSACLLQSSDSKPKIKMHRIIRRLGLWLATNEEKFLVEAGLGLEEAPAAEFWDDRTRISLMFNDIKDLPISPCCSNLQTLLLQNNPKLVGLAPGFFKSMSSLRVLDLSHTGITRLPEKCDALVSLQHLNLSHTPIRYLPRRFWVLKELRHLDLSVTTELKDTFNNCSKLSELRVLNLFRSFYGIREVDNLNLDTLKKLIFLGIAIYAEDVLRKLKKTDPLARSTHRLNLKHCEGMKYIQVSGFNQMVLLEELYIESCNDLEKLVVDADVQRASCLKVLTLSHLSNLDSIAVVMVPHQFQNLRELTINECHKLENITWVLRLESLEELVVSHCNGMEHVVQEATSGIQTPGSNCSYGSGIINVQPRSSEEQEVQELVEEAFHLHMKNHEGRLRGNGMQRFEQGQSSVMHGADFPRLRSIMLINLVNLVSICSARHFPLLQSIRVEDCPKLRRLPVGRNYKMARLKQICGSFEWWKGLGWEDEEMVAHLEDCFIPI